MVASHVRTNIYSSVTHCCK